MAKLIYLMLASLDGYAVDEAGNFDWAAPDEEVHRFINDLVRPVGTYLYGRRMYEVMTAWENMHTRPDPPPHILDFAHIWQAADKIVYSRTLAQVSSARTHIQGEFDPEVIQLLKASAEHGLAVGGPELASQALAAGLVDELHLFLAPILVGSGRPFLSVNDQRKLELLDERRFDNGMVYLHYRILAAG